MRSMRASDIGIVSPVDATVVTSGAAAPHDRPDRGRRHHVLQRGRRGHLPRRRRARAPYNLFADLTTIAKVGHAEAAPPARLPAVGRRRRTCRGASRRPPSGASFSGGHTTEWSYGGGGYVNDNTYAGADDQFPADTVLVLRVEVGDAGYLDPAGNPVPETKLEGEGAGACSSTAVGWSAAPGPRAG